MTVCHWDYLQLGTKCPVVDGGVRIGEGRELKSIEHQLLTVIRLSTIHYKS